MKYDLFNVTVRPDCCSLSVTAVPDMAFPNGVDDPLLVARKRSGQVPLVKLGVDEAPVYQHGDHPFARVYDIRGALALYRDPTLFGWVDTDGRARYIMAVPGA